MGCEHSAHVPDVDMKGRVVIVTGSNSGIGYATAKGLSYMGAKVIVACRNEEKGQKAIAQMKEEISQEKETARELDLEVMALDLNSLQSVVKFAEAYKQKGYPLHVLLCNAGIGLGPKAITDDGFEQQFQVNYLGHFLLILHLLPVLREGGSDCRIISVSSTAHKGGKLDLDNIQAQKSYDRLQFYDNSKFFQVMMTYALRRRLQSTSIRVLSLHPGGVDSGFQNSSSDSTFWRIGWKFAKATGVTKDLAYGAATSVILASSPSIIEKPEVYYEPIAKPVQPAPKSKVEADQETLWQYSVDLLKEKGCITDDNLRGLEAASS